MAHRMQLVELPVPGWYCPLAHSLHPEAPDAVWNWPRKHSTQLELLPGDCWNCPGLQALHSDLAPASWNLWCPHKIHTQTKTPIQKKTGN